MKQEKSFSLNSNNSFLSGRRLEQSILNEYKRVSFGQESFYYSADSIEYAPLHSNIPESLRQQFTHCIWLQNNPFYEVFTLAIFQYLLREPTPKKIHAVNKLKNLVCNQHFLPFSSYMKGLLLKGLKIMLQNTNYNRPIAECLLGNQKLSAFSECWKEMIAQSSKSFQNVSDSSKSLISVLATFFDIDLHFYTLKGKQYQLEVIKSLKKTKDKTAVIPLILVPNYFHTEGDNQKEQKEDSFSSISSIYGYWSYFILLNYSNISNKLDLSIPSIKKNQEKQVKRQKTLLGQYPQLFAIDQQKAQSSKISVQGDDRLSKFQCLTKGEKLLSEMKSFINEIKKTAIKN